MKKFNKNKYLKKLRFNKYKRYLYIGIPCLLVLLIGIYFTYSKFFVSTEEEVVRTTVGDFIFGDVVIGAYIDGEYSKSLPGKWDGYAVDKVVCDNGAVGEWNYSRWGLLTTNVTQRSKCNVYFIPKELNVADSIMASLDSDSSMFATDDPGKNIRYIGKDPNNYIYFNCNDYNNQTDDTCELWRIIGVFNNVTKEDGSKENLVKIIRADSLGYYSWDYKKMGVGTSISDDEDYDFGSNDWSDSQLMMMLNPTNYLKSGYKISGDVVLDTNNQEIYSKIGSYYNGTKGCRPAEIDSGASFSCIEVDFTSTGLKNDITRNAIESIVWNLGSNDDNTSTASMYYTAERGTTVYMGRPTTWIGKIGLMYPSDYGYATSGGTAKDRAACLAKGLNGWGSSDFVDCKENDYLYNYNGKVNGYWTLMPRNYGSNTSYVIGIYYYDGTASIFPPLRSNGVSPTLFLKSNISIKSGTGESSNPYQLKLY